MEHPATIEEAVKEYPELLLEVKRLRKAKEQLEALAENKRPLRIHSEKRAQTDQECTRVNRIANSNFYKGNNAQIQISYQVSDEQILNSEGNH